jgi:hypothetical protein
MRAKLVRRWVVVATGTLLGLTAVACTPSPESSSAVEVCAPPGTAIAAATVRVIEAPWGATVTVESAWHLYPGQGPIEDSGVVETVIGGLGEGQIHQLSDGFLPYPDRCLHVFPANGARVQVTLIAADPITQLAWAAGYRPGPAILG